MSDSKKHILVLDDDPDIGSMIRIMLEYKGYNVSIAERAERAFELLEKDQFNLLITDMLLSGTNGTDICTQLKNNPSTAGVPIIMISAHPNARQICEEAGADDFIAKPFDMHQLFSKIGALIG